MKLYRAISQNEKEALLAGEEFVVKETLIKSYNISQVKFL